MGHLDDEARPEAEPGLTKHNPAPRCACVHCRSVLAAFGAPYDECLLTDEEIRERFPDHNFEGREPGANPRRSRLFQEYRREVAM
jgi:hypothetical protein